MVLESATNDLFVDFVSRFENSRKLSELTVVASGSSAFSNWQPNVTELVSQ